MPRLGVLPAKKPRRRGSGTGRKTMNKLKMIAITALAAATVGVGSLVAAPSASAMPRCQEYEARALMYESLEAVAEGQGDYALATYYNFWAQYNYRMAIRCYG
jgi:hypothetical protein